MAEAIEQLQPKEKKLKEVADYIASRPSLANLITNIGRTIPENLAIDSFDLRANTLTLRATVREASDMASGYASSYVNVLREVPEFTDLFEKVSLTNLNRVADTGRLAIEVVVEISDPNKKAKIQTNP